MTTYVQSGAIRRAGLCGLLALAALGLLSGCERLQELRLSNEAKRLKAFPATGNEAAARSALLASMPASGPGDGQRTHFEGGYEARLAERARRCTAGQTVGFTTTSQALRARATGDGCSGDDPALLAWFTQHRIGALLAQPPSWPVQALGPLRLSGVMRGGALQHMAVAAQADVVLLADAASHYLLVRLSTGELLLRLDAPVLPDAAPLISPNGRLAALPDGNQRWRVLELATGNELWTVDGVRRLSAWLPEAGALLGDAAVDGKPLLIDFWGGTQTARPDLDLAGATAWRDPARPQDLWLWHKGRVLQQHFERTPAGIGLQAKGGVGLGLLADPQGPPPVHVGARWWLGQGTFDQFGLIDMQAANPQIRSQLLGGHWDGPARLDDHRALLLLQAQGERPAELVVLDLASRQVQSHALPGPQLRLHSLGARPGFLLANDEGLRIGASLEGLVPVGEPVPLDEWLLRERPRP